MDQELQILILEDNPADAELAERELRKAGIHFTARRATDKPTFIAALQAFAPDLVLSDFSLPGFDGLAALALARERFADVPVIIVSGVMGEETATEALKAGATDYVLKQRLARLGPVVKRALREAEQLRERKRTEEQLAQERAALHRSEQTLRLLIDGVRDCAIYLISPDGLVQTWNAGAQRVTQWSAGEIMGGPIAAFFTPADLARGAPQRQLEIATQEGRFDEEGFRARKDGSIFWAQITLTAIHDDQGTLRGFATVLRDITQRVRADVELSASRLIAERARAEAEAANSAKDHFLAVLSHELRTPLTPALATVAMLRDDPRFDAETRENLEVVRRNIDLEARLIDDLLDVTRIERGKVELDCHPTQLCTIIRRAVDVCMPDIEARQLEFGVTMVDGPYFVDADLTRLQQVFWNLLKNAIKFTPHGGCVGVHCFRDGDGHVIAQVNDSGEGIDPEVLPRIFRPFEQGDKRITRQFGGLGLGLAICKGIVERHGGTIDAHSAGKGKGASFTIRLPLCQAPVSPRQPGASPAQTGSPIPSRKLAILLVEDHGDTARIMKRLLTANGHDVRTAGDVATALELIESNRFDLLISDLGLPDGSGVDLMRELRRRGNHLQGIALSGYGQEEDIRRTMEAGFAAHLTKPTNPARLANTIASVTA